MLQEQVAIAPSPGETALLPEDSEDDAPLEVVPDRRRVKTDKQDVPVETLHVRVKQAKIDPQPEFQRYFVWNNTKASRLIESLLMDIPIPVIYSGVQGLLPKSCS